MKRLHCTVGESRGRQSPLSPRFMTWRKLLAYRAGAGGGSWLDRPSAFGSVPSLGGLKPQRAGNSQRSEINRWDKLRRGKQECLRRVVKGSGLGHREIFDRVNDRSHALRRNWTLIGR